MNNSEIQNIILKSICNIIREYIQKSAGIESDADYYSENFQKNIQQTTNDSFKKLLQHGVNFILNECLDPILYPSEVYDNLDAVATIDVDNSINLLYGFTMGTEKAFTYVWELFANTTINNEQESNKSLETIRIRLIDEGLFPDEYDSWDRKYTALFTTSERNHVGSKRYRVDTEIITTNTDTREDFLTYLLRDIETEGFNLSAPWRIRSKYSAAAKNILHGKVSGTNDQESISIKRGLFMIFPQFIKTMDSLNKSKVLEYSGITYSTQRRAKNGTLQVALELTKDIFVQPKISL